jgi:hypothetical protein
MVAALLLALDDQRPPGAGDFRAEARPGDPAADDYDVKLTHRPRGYELESRAV